tara:strand:+ start:202 stop:687 length:486 start_codon:yes stop_codon:yes gene_type:complete
MDHYGRGGASQTYATSGHQGNPYLAIDPLAYRGISAKEYPGDMLYADVIAAQTQDYLTRFAPIERELAATITPTGTTYIDDDLARTRAAFSGASAGMQGTLERRNSRLGINPTGIQGFQNEAVGALVGGINATYQRDQDRRNALLSGGLGDVGRQLRQVAT